MFSIYINTKNMSSTVQDALKFNFNEDTERMENDYVASDMQWIYINDQNSFNYSNGYINFTNTNLIGASQDKFFDWSQAYVVIPYTVSLSNSGCTFTTDGTAITPENALALAVKGNQHLIDIAYIKFNSVQVNRATNYLNLYQNEKLKMLSEEEYKLFGDIMNVSFDNADSYDFNQPILETNNVIKAINVSVNTNSTLTYDVATPANSTVASTSTTTVNAYTKGNTPASFVNDAHLKRMLKNNFDYTSANSNYVQGTTITSTTLTDTLLSTFYSNTADNLVFQYTAIVPLANIHDFYAKLPIVQNSLGFELKLQLNIGGNNSWTANYTGSAAGVLTAANLGQPISITANQNIGHTCPFILSQAGVNAGTGLCIRPTAAAPCSVTIKSYIGWLNNAAPTSSIQPSGNPCRIYVPQISYTPSYTQMLLKQPKYRLLYEDFYVDQYLNGTSNANVSKLFNAQVGRPRTLYIIPFFSQSYGTTTADDVTTVTAVSPYMSPVSSAPTTCSLCRISNCQISIGGQNIFIEPQQYNYHFYNNNLLPLLGKINGNSLKSRFQTGQIKMSDWSKCYNVFAFNMQKVSDEIQDNIEKQFQLQFKIDTNGTYDFFFLLTFQNELYIDQISGTITSQP